MALTCPRCGTDVPSEALYCPYCSLPKPKRGFAGGAKDNREETKPTEQPQARVAVRESKRANKRRPAHPRNTSRKLRLPVLSAGVLVALLSVGIYIFVVPLVYSDEAEPKTVLAALDKLRRTPSSEPGVTIDARLSRALEASRRVGDLVAYQGWTVRPIKGTKTKVLIVFAYQEVGGTHQRAEWLADLSNNTFTPQTDLAAAVHSKQ
ncbi:MAG: zinc ribbon domain-containing protein [Acidobacteriota bacterium]